MSYYFDMKESVMYFSDQWYQDKGYSCHWYFKTYVYVGDVVFPTVFINCLN